LAARRFAGRGLARPGDELSANPTPRPIEDRLAQAGLPPLPRTAWAEIDLDALTGNLAALRAAAGPGTPVHPVVKGNAYGHGMVPVARALADAGANGFCVATLDEALALRYAGVARPIMVMFPIPPRLAGEARRHSIGITIGDRTLLDELLAALPHDPGEPRLPVELEIETGLGRGGFGSEAVVDAARALSASDAVSLEGAWTHLQAPEDATRARAQEAAFEVATRLLVESGLPLRRRHVAASGSLALGDALTLDGVRPGLAIYGLVPDELLKRATITGLRPALALRARPVRVAELPAGTGISYGPTFTTARPSRIATLPLGYGDGWSRALSNRGFALVRGVRVPLVGNVAMDAVMADVTDVAGPPVSVHDEFVLIGRQGDQVITAADVAAARGTNSWEVLTTLAARLPRVYHAASVPRQTWTLLGGAEASTAGDRTGGRSMER
jgi:alanine racemase